MNGYKNASPPLPSFESPRCGTGPHQLDGGLHILWEGSRWAWETLCYPGFLSSIGNQEYLRESHFP